MTYDNHNPLVNPLNKSAYQYTGFLHKDHNAKLPEADLFCPIVKSGTGCVQTAADLHVPNQDVPYGSMLAGNGFLGKSPFFRCMDGTVLNMQTRQVVFKPNENETKTLDYSKTSPTWDNKDIFSIDPNQSKDVWNDPGFIHAQVNKVRQEVSQLSADMTTQQKAWLDSFAAEHTDPRWVDESKKI